MFGTYKLHEATNGMVLLCLSTVIIKSLHSITQTDSSTDNKGHLKLSSRVSQYVSK